MKKQHYMTWDERQQLETLHRAGVSVAEIAKQLGFCRQTIYNQTNKEGKGYTREPLALFYYAVI